MSGNELFSLILMAAILIGVGVFVAQPLLQGRPKNILDDEFDESPLQHLLARKDSVYTALKDLEFDYATGKLSEQDYKDLREKSAAQAAEVLKEIDETESGVKSAKQPAKRKKAAASFCRACGFKSRPGDRFCQSCGAPMA